MLEPVPVANQEFFYDQWQTCSMIKRIQVTHLFVFEFDFLIVFDHCHRQLTSRMVVSDCKILTNGSYIDEIKILIKCIFKIKFFFLPTRIFFKTRNYRPKNPHCIQIKCRNVSNEVVTIIIHIL